METLNEDRQNLVRKVAEENGFTNYDVTVNEVSGDGDGYMGNLVGLNVTDRESDKRLCFALKMASSNENLRKMIPTRGMFLREIYFYETVFPEIIKFQEEYNISNQFKGIPPYYGSIKDEGNESILLGNIKEDNYKMTNRREPMDSNHLRATIIEYAKLHAISFAMWTLERTRFDKLTTPIRKNVLLEFMQSEQDMQNKLDSGDPEGFFGPVLEVLQGREKELKAVQHYSKTISHEIFAKFMFSEDNKIISHADCWSTNMLYKYEDQSHPNIPTNVCFIDWQLSYLTPAVFDITYFFYICAGKEDLHNYKTYLNIYYSALSENIRAFGLDPLEVYPLDVFEQDWKQYSKWGIFTAILMLPQSLSEKKTHNFEEMADKNQNALDPNQRKHIITEEYKKRIIDLIEFVVANDFL